MNPIVDPNMLRDAAERHAGDIINTAISQNPEAFQGLLIAVLLAGGAAFLCFMSWVFKAIGRVIDFVFRPLLR